MKYILIAVFIMEPVTTIVPPLATSFTAEFDDLTACEAQATIVSALKTRAARKVWCAPKATNSPASASGATAGEAIGAPK